MSSVQTESPLVSFSEVSKEFGGRNRALDGVSLNVQPGGVVGLIGENGAGKTTLIRILMGFVRPSAGEVRILGKPAGSMYRRIGFVPDLPKYHVLYKARKLLLHLAYLRGLGRKKAMIECDQALGLVGLSDVADRPLWQFSKGMLQRFSLAQSSMGDPELLVMDEPMSGLDPVGQKQMRDIIVQMRRDGRTIIVSSHHLFHMEKICDTVIFLHRGSIKYQGPPTNLGAGQAPVVISLGTRVSDMDAAWLTSAGASLVGESGWQLPSGDKDRVNSVLRYLVDRDIEVKSLVRQEGSLERFFLEQIGAD